MGAAQDLWRELDSVTRQFYLNAGWLNTQQALNPNDAWFNVGNYHTALRAAYQATMSQYYQTGIFDPRSPWIGASEWDIRPNPTVKWYGYGVEEIDYFFDAGNLFWTESPRPKFKIRRQPSRGGPQHRRNLD